MITLRPRGPSVTFHGAGELLHPDADALARLDVVADLLGPSDSFLGEGVGEPLSLDHGEDVALAHDQELLALVLDLGAGVRREEHAVADLERHLLALALVVHLALADGEDLAFLGLVLGRLGQEDPAGGLLLASARCTITRSPRGWMLSLPLVLVVMTASRDCGTSLDGTLVPPAACDEVNGVQLLIARSKGRPSALSTVRRSAMGSTGFLR
jgi:hypothetical protein